MTKRERQDRAVSLSRGEARRASLVDAGLLILSEDGWPGLTHRKVARRAGANPALVQYYFSNTAGLRSAITQAVSDRLVTPMATRLLSAADIPTLIEICAHEVQDAFRQPTLVHLLAQTLVGMSQYEEVRDVVAADLARVEERIALHLIAIDARPRHHAQEDAAMLIATIDGLILHSLRGTTHVQSNFGGNRLRQAFSFALRHPPH